MTKTKTLLSMVSIGMLISCSDVSTKHEGKIVPTMMSSEINSSRAIDENITQKDKKFQLKLEKLEQKQREQELLSSLEESKLKQSNKQLLEELQKLKWEREVLNEKFELQKATDEKHNYEQVQKQQRELDKWRAKASIADAKAKELQTEILLKESNLELMQNQLRTEMEIFKMKKEREAYLDLNSSYLQNPLSEDNQTISISDRRVDLNGIITYEMAENISNQINYYNNKDSKKPIFLMIDSSPGGSIMAGTVILRSIESSKAPVYVVLKSMAASMAAVIVTLAENSYAYPHAVILHHQPMSFSYGYSNLTEQKEKYEELQMWWSTFGSPIAKKMGISDEEFIKQMYQHSSRGDWEEFAVEAEKLKWVNNIVNHIEDRSVLVDPSYQKEDKNKSKEFYATFIGEDKKEHSYLPHLRAADAFFIYNPDGYFLRR